MSAVTKDGVVVKVGQVWRDLDKRTRRTVTVERIIERPAGHGWHAEVISSNGARSRIAIKRMHRHGQGFALVSESQP